MRPLAEPEASHCSPGDRRLIGTELSLYPLWLSPSETALWLRGDSGGGGTFSGRCGMWCWWMEWRPDTIYPLSTARPSDDCQAITLCNSRANCGERVSFEWKVQTKPDNKICFDSIHFAMWFTSDRELLGCGNGSWKIRSSHVFRHQRRWHKTEFLCDLSDFLHHRNVIARCRYYQTIEWTQRFFESDSEAWKGTALPCRRVHVPVTSSPAHEHPGRERQTRARDRQGDERKYERGGRELSR